MYKFPDFPTLSYRQCLTPIIADNIDISLVLAVYLLVTLTFVSFVADRLTLSDVGMNLVTSPITFLI